MQQRRFLVGIVIGLVFGWLAHSYASDTNAYTLYRNSVLDASMRIHIATFDANESESTYNINNCHQAQTLFQQQPDIKTRFWCEKGRYRP